ncbi:hypothetical protein Lfu02_78080 [Longispora fulva]|uniref:Ketosteroid isomerase-like protein n=1 Tax=Longispora fulva TaxID=619741 RepID=A0A8J7GHB5_9ACTN|nr:nuclear transport factor 2 family protein [Longispora fulva]MBG6136253.1 ketosteroid isomerase-like protein [Longispora fulva]GIG63436.1 hypothetical protein Lfu02_78080 [Longispora fulva]
MITDGHGPCAPEAAADRADPTFFVARPEADRYGCPMLSPREVFLNLVNGVCEERWTDLPELYAEDTHISHPFDPYRSGPLLSRAAIQQHFTPPAGSTSPIKRRPVVTAVHETTDPEVIVAEFEYQGTVIASGEPFAIPCVFVMRIRDGKIVESRDYMDHVRSAQSRGTTEQLIQAITE